METENMEMEVLNGDVVETTLAEEEGGFGVKDVIAVLGIAGAGYVVGTQAKKGLKWVGNTVKTKLSKLKEKKAAEKDTAENVETESKEK